MELLIPGLILVGLMAYVSTRIKKSAAAAYEPEEIETDEFSIRKPEGFLNPLNSNSGLPFEAYTKEFGEDEARKLRRAWAELTVHENTTLEEAIEIAKTGIETVVFEETVMQYDRRIGILDGERRENDVEIAVFHKFAGKEGKVYDLKISVLDEYKDDYQGKIEEMRDSFTVK